MVQALGATVDLESQQSKQEWNQEEADPSKEQDHNQTENVHYQPISLFNYWTPFVFAEGTLDFFRSIFST